MDLSFLQTLLELIINPNIFLPTKTFVVFKVFIAWLNLDLGITTCFFDG